MAEAKRGRPRDRRKAEATIAYSLRESVVYRAEALAWHASMLDLLNRAAPRRLAAVEQDDAAEYQLLIHIAYEHFYLFDDLAFNALSLFDYVGNTVGFTLYGDQRRKARWDRIEHFARDAAYETRAHTTPRISGTPLGRCISSVQAAFVGQLAEVRASLIHYEALFGPGTFTKSYGADTDSGIAYSLDFRVHPAFGKRLVVPGYELAPAEAPLLEAAHWLASEACHCASGILHELERTLRMEGGYTPDGLDGVIDIP
jgi:hypothetical protein